MRQLKKLKQIVKIQRELEMGKDSSGGKVYQWNTQPKNHRLRVLYVQSHLHPENPFLPPRRILLINIQIQYILYGLYSIKDRRLTVIAATVIIGLAFDPVFGSLRLGNDYSLCLGKISGTRSTRFLPPATTISHLNRNRTHMTVNTGKITSGNGFLFLNSIYSIHVQVRAFDNRLYEFSGYSTMKSLRVGYSNADIIAEMGSI